MTQKKNCVKVCILKRSDYGATEATRAAKHTEPVSRESVEKETPPTLENNLEELRLC